MTELDLRNYKNRHSFGSKLKRALWNIVWRCLFRPTPDRGIEFFVRWRFFLLRLFGAKIGRYCAICCSCKIWQPWNLEIGDWVALDEDSDIYDMKGRCLGPVRRAVLKTNRIAGCVAAYRRETFDVFGDCVIKETTDDGVFGPRSNLLGPVDYVNEPLVLYRVGAGSSRCVRGFRTMRVKNFRATHKWVAQCELDLEKYRLHLTPERYAEEKAGLAAWHAQADGNVAQWDGSWLTRAKGMWARPFCTFLTPGGLMLLVLLLPLRIADFVLDSVLWVHHLKLLLKYGHCFDGCEGRGEHLAERCRKLYRH